MKKNANGHPACRFFPRNRFEVVSKRRLFKTENQAVVHIPNVIRKKELARNHFRASSNDYILTSLSSDSSDDTDGGGSSGAHSSTRGRCNSRSTDRVDSIHTDNSHSRTRRLDNPPQFRPKPAPQNAALERKPIHLPSMQLTEASSL
jgi:hypothetical protein